MNERTCSVDGCDRTDVVGRGWCRKHYYRWYRHGTVEDSPPREKSPKPPCGVSDCARSSFCRGWCRSHYMRWWKHGTLIEDKPLPGDLESGCGWCFKCRERKPLADFYPQPGRPSGRSSYCRTCMAGLRSTKYRVALLAQQRRWRTANPEKSAEYTRVWREKNPERVRATKLSWIERNPERALAIRRACEHNRRARERSAPGWASTDQIAARWDYFGGKCWMCGGEAHEVDHVKPLSKGGSNWPSNMRPACRECNSRKRAKWPYDLSLNGMRRGPAGPVAVVAEAG